MNTEYKINGLHANIIGAYDYRHETVLKLEDEKNTIEKSIYTIKLFEDKIVIIDNLIVSYKKELAVLENDDIEEQVEDYDLAINTAYDIMSVYKSEIEFEFLNSEDEIDYNLITVNQKNVDKLEKTIKEMEQKRGDLQRISNLHSVNLTELKEDRDFNDFLCACDSEDITIDNELSIFDDDLYADEKFSDYQAWTLDALYNEDGSY